MEIQIILTKEEITLVTIRNNRINALQEEKAKMRIEVGTEIDNK